MPQRRLSDFMEKSVSIYAYGIAFLLVLYMLGSIFFEGVSFISNYNDIVSVSGDPNAYEEKSRIEKDLLHTIAFGLVLIKAFTILMAYGRVHHINIKHLIEIAIIAPVIEVVFNAHAYSLGINILFASLAAVSMAIYLFFYKTLKQVNEDFKKHDKVKLDVPNPLKKFKH